MIKCSEQLYSGISSQKYHVESQLTGILNSSCIKCDRLRPSPGNEPFKNHQTRNLQNTEYRNSQFIKQLGTLFVVRKNLKSDQSYSRGNWTSDETVAVWQDRVGLGSSLHPTRSWAQVPVSSPSSCPHHLFVTMTFCHRKKLLLMGFTSPYESVLEMA